jgi:hypothetical protein
MLAFGRVSFCGHFGQSDVADGDPEHDPLGVRVGHLRGQLASFIRSCSPMSGVVNSVSHDEQSHTTMRILYHVHGTPQEAG